MSLVVSLSERAVTISAGGRVSCIKTCSILLGLQQGSSGSNSSQYVANLTLTRHGEMLFPSDTRYILPLSIASEVRHLGGHYVISFDHFSRPTICLVDAFLPIQLVRYRAGTSSVSVGDSRSKLGA